MEVTTDDLLSFLSENAECWERAACLFNQMANLPSEGAPGNKTLWNLQAAAYHERSNLCRHFCIEFHHSIEHSSSTKQSDASRSGDRIPER